VRGRVPPARVAALLSHTQARRLGRDQRERDIAHHYGVGASRRLEVDLGHLAAIGGSSLTDASVPVPDGDLDRAWVPSSYVPFRNANLLAVGAAWGEVLGARALYFGAMEEDSSGYPDCRGVFVEAFNRLDDMACGRCDSCLLRLRGFREAGASDPIPYAEAPE
jgi:7-cyano-7-deazaguanine synthase